MKSERKSGRRGKQDGIIVLRELMSIASIGDSRKKAETPQDVDCGMP